MRARKRHLKVAERVGFEPTCRLPDKTLSRRPRYDHFGTSPQIGRPDGFFATSSCGIAPPRPAHAPRRSAKNACINSRHSDSSMPLTTSTR